MASFCVVTGQVVDPQGHPYINASLEVTFIPAPTATLAPSIGAIQTFQTLFAQANCDATGRFVRSGLANNALINDGHAPGQQGSQWCFRFYTGPGYVPQISFVWCGIITGNMDITSQLAAVAPPIIPPCGGGGPINPPPNVPAITGLSPNTGPVGTVVTITGSNFGVAQGSSTVTLNGIPMTVTGWSNTSITVTVPSGASTGNVVVTTANGTSNGMTFTVTTTPPGAPVLTAISPASGTVGTNVNITLTGSNLTGTTAVNASGGVTVSNVVIVSSTSVTATLTLPAAAVTSNITVTTSAGTSNALTFSVTAAGTAPTLTTITPSSAAANTAAVMTLAGTGLTGATAVNYSGTGVTLSNLSVASNTSLTETFGISSTATSGNVSVTAPGGTTNAVPFTVTAAVPPAGPIISSISPASGNPSSSVNITINGTGFIGNPAIAPTTVQYDGTGITISSLAVVNDISITCTLTIAAGATSGHLTVTTPSGTSNGASFAVSGAAAPTTPSGYLSFIYGGITIVGGTHAGQNGIYASMQTPVPATAVAGASVTTVGTGTYDGVFVIASASGTDLVLVAGSNSATQIISKQGIIRFP